MFRVFNGLFALAFAASALLQLNDPDPLLWGGFYAIATMACFMKPGVRAAWAIGIVLACAVGLAGAALPEAMKVTSPGELVAAMSPDRPQTEAVRELGGALLVGIWMVVLLRRLRGQLFGPPAPPA